MTRLPSTTALAVVVAVLALAAAAGAPGSADPGSGASVDGGEVRPQSGGGTGSTLAVAALLVGATAFAAAARAK